MIPYDFDYYRPKTLEEALQLSKELKMAGQKAIYYGGGTEFISMSRLNNVYTDAVIDIKDIEECLYYQMEGDELIIGAGLSLTQLAEVNLFPLMSRAIKRIADHTVQDKVTIGGNLMGSIIYREASLALLVANADILIGNKNGLERLDFNDYWRRRVEDRREDLIIQLIINKKYLDLPHAHVKRTKNEKIETVEGLKNAPIQKAFIENFAFQCGYCTSGFIMACHSLAKIHPHADDLQIQDWLQSNICRCTSYQEIETAVKSILKGEVLEEG